MNFADKAYKAIDAPGPILGTWLVKSCSNKLKLDYPSREYIAKILADLTPSLKNFNVNPGVTLGGLNVACFALDILIIKLSAPLKIPVYGCYPLLMN